MAPSDHDYIDVRVDIGVLKTQVSTLTTLCTKMDDVIEKIVEQDDATMQEYLEGKSIELPKLKQLLRKAVIANDIFPVFCGSALKNKGVDVQLVLDKSQAAGPTERPEIAKLKAAGVPVLHYYTLGKPKVIAEVVKAVF